MFTRNKGQSIAEYAVLLSLVIAAVVAMQVYVKRGIQAKVKTGTDAYTGAGVGTTITVEGGGQATLSKLDQYEPYYQESTYNRYQESVEQEHMGGGKVVKEKVSDITAAKAGGYERQVSDSATRTNRDQVWTGGTTGGTPPQSPQ